MKLLDAKSLYCMIYCQSFFASLDPEDDVGQFVRLVDTREPLKMFSRSPTGSDDSGSSGGNMSGSVNKSKVLLSGYKLWFKDQASHIHEIY